MLISNLIPLIYYRISSLWFSTMQILQHGHSCSLQYKRNFSWCSSQCSLISSTYDGNFEIRQNRDTNSSAVKDQKKIIENEIQELRTKIITHIDKLQEDLIKELTEAEKHMQVAIVFRMVSILYNSLVWFRCSLLISDYKHVSCVSTSFSICFRAKYVCKSDTYFLCWPILKTIATCIKKFGEIVVESKPCEMNFVRKKDKQAQMMITNLSQPMSVQNIQLNLKQKINTKGRGITGCSLLPGGRMVSDFLCLL
jgi:hypothetical protein